LDRPYWEYGSHRCHWKYGPDWLDGVDGYDGANR
jgi:hypothetical protein